MDAAQLDELRKLRRPKKAGAPAVGAQPVVAEDGEVAVAYRHAALDPELMVAKDRAVTLVELEVAPRPMATAKHARRAIWLARRCLCTWRDGIMLLITSRYARYVS